MSREGVALVAKSAKIEVTGGTIFLSSSDGMGGGCGSSAALRGGSNCVLDVGFESSLMKEFTSMKLRIRSTSALTLASVMASVVAGGDWTGPWSFAMSFSVEDFCS